VVMERGGRAARVVDMPDMVESAPGSF
jgi:hypothetical protein